MRLNIPDPIKTLPDVDIFVIGSSVAALTHTRPSQVQVMAKPAPTGLVEFDGWIVSREDKLALIQMQVRTLEGSVAGKDAEIAKLKEELETIKSSRSWRLTRHFRRWTNEEE